MILILIWYTYYFLKYNTAIDDTFNPFYLIVACANNFHTYISRYQMLNNTFLCIDRITISILPQFIRISFSWIIFFLSRPSGKLRVSFYLPKDSRQYMSMRLYCILKFSALYNGETRTRRRWARSCSSLNTSERVAEYKQEVMFFVVLPSICNNEERVETV